MDVDTGHYFQDGDTEVGDIANALSIDGICIMHIAWFILHFRSNTC